MATWVQANFELLTADGTATGYASVADASQFFVGATVYLVSNTQASLECFVIDIVGNQVGLGLASSGPASGHTDISAYLIADNASLNQPKQLVSRVPQLKDTASGSTATATTSKPAGLEYTPSGVVLLASCNAGGTTTATLPAGDYEVAAFNESVWFDFAATVATGGMRLAPGQVTYIHVPASTSVAGRSNGGTADLQFTPYVA